MIKFKAGSAAGRFIECILAERNPTLQQATQMIGKRYKINSKHDKSRFHANNCLVQCGK